MEQYRITYLHHSGFICELKDCILVFDYYTDPAGRLEEVLENAEKPVYFFVSHFHGDHFNPSIRRYEKRAAGYILHSDCSLKVVDCDRIHHIEVGDSLVTDHFQVRMYGSTDVGGSFWIFHAGGSIFHAGDLNWWHWAGESDLENGDARDMFFKELKNIDETEADIVFFPVDARQAVAREWGVKAFLDKIRVKSILVPMHAFGSRWVPSYEFRWKYPDVPLWIPKEDGEIYTGEK